MKTNKPDGNAGIVQWYLQLHRPRAHGNLRQDKSIQIISSSGHLLPAPARSAYYYGMEQSLILNRNTTSLSGARPQTNYLPQRSENLGNALTPSFDDFPGFPITLD